MSLELSNVSQVVRWWCASAMLSVLAGCGSGSAVAPAVPASSGPARAAGATSAAASANSTGQDGAQPGAGSASSKTATAGDVVLFCNTVRAQKAMLAGKQMSALLAGGTPATWKAYLAKATAMNQQLVDTAPPQIRPSVVTLQSTTLALTSTLSAAGYDVTKVDTHTLLKRISSAQQLHATTTLTSYARTTCHVELAKATG